MGRLPELTGLRGWAALYVALYHAWQLFERAPGDPSFLTNVVYRYGWLGVDLFFVLSAFLLTLPILRKASEARGIRFWVDYLRRRWIRIAPPYYASIILALALAGTLNYVWSNPEGILLHILYAPNLVDGAVWGINPVFWSLAVEFQFYIVLPVILWFLLRTHPIVGLGVAYAASMAWNFVTIDMVDPAADNFWAVSQLPGYLFHFALGITGARLYHKGFTIKPHLRPFAWALVPVLVFGAVLLAAPPSDSWLKLAAAPGTLIVRAAPALGFALLILLATTPGRAATLMFANPYSRALGDMSYSLYLAHLPIMLFFAHKMPWTLDYGFAMFQLLLVAPVMLGTWLLYRFVEVPSLAWKDRTKQPQPKPVDTPPVVTTAASTAVQARPIES